MTSMRITTRLKRSKVPSGQLSHKPTARGAALLFLAAFVLLTGALLIQNVVRASAATIWYVDDDTCPSAGSGTSGDPFCSIQDAIDAAASGDVIHVAAGTYYENLTIDEHVTILGENRDNTTIDGGNLDAVIDIDPAYVVGISFVTITHGNNTGSMEGGGGVHNSGDLTLSNCAVSDNYAEPRGGGLYNDVGATMTISRCVIEGNTVDLVGEGWGGGGIYNGFGTLTVQDSSIRDNHAVNYGVAGGVFNDAGNMTLERVTISANTSTQYAGGVHSALLPSGSSTLINVTISGNTSKSGGGIGTAGGVSTGLTSIQNSTIAGNIATETSSGGGLQAWGRVEIQNSIIDNNSLLECGGDPATYITSGGYNLAEDDTCGLLATGDQQSADAKLGLLQDYGGLTETMALGWGSPAIDAGSPATPGTGGGACESLDQREWVRPIDADLDGTARCDIGAYEKTIDLFLPLIMR